MSFTIVGSNTFAFADGNAGHVVNLGSSPSVGQFDLLCVNSDTTVSTPSGFTVAPSAVTNQGAYIFRRKAAGGEGSTVTITTTGNFNAHVIWVRLGGANAADAAGAAETNSSPGGTTSPAFTSSALGETGEIGIAFSALHSFNGSAVPTAPDWSGSGYTAITGGTTGGTSVHDCGGFVAYKTPVGTAAESPSMSFTNSATNRYMLFISFTAAAVTSVDGTVAGTLGGITGALTGSSPNVGTVAGTLGGITGALTGTTQTTGAVAGTLGGLTGSLTADTPAPTTVERRPQPGWYGYLNIAREAAQLAADYRSRPPIACPHDGEPLQSKGGQLWCPFDGYRWPE